MNYADKLKDPRWQKRRLEIFKRDGFTCQLCAMNTRTLHVHHRVYESGKEPWEYADHLLVTLCEVCHKSEGETKELAMKRLYQAFLTAGFFNDDLLQLSKSISQFKPRFWMAETLVLEEFFKNEDVYEMAKRIVNSKHQTTDLPF